MTADPWPVFCGRCRTSPEQPAEWLVTSQGPRTAGWRSAVCCDACLPATERWCTRDGRAPVVEALHPDQPTTLF